MKILKTLILILMTSAFLYACGGGGGGEDGSNDTVPVSSAKAITTFSLGGVTGTINETAKSISVTMPNGTNITALIATFTTTGTSVKVGSTIQTSGTTANDFTSPVSYMVTAADNSTATYTVTVAAITVNLPKTGQTTSHAAGDDGDLEKGVAWPDPRFTVGTGAEADCVTDNLTGLMWVKSPDSTTRTWQEALTYANDLSFCGYTDWRLPNINELESLGNVGQPNSSTWLNTQGFSNVQANAYWSSTPYTVNSNGAWVVNMYVGNMSLSSKASSSYVWTMRTSQVTATIDLPKTGQTTCYDDAGAVITCAGTGQDGDLQNGVAWPSPRFTVGTGAAVDCETDNLTGLMWAKTPDSTKRTWADALTYANDLNLCSYSDWRLPNRKELRSLINYSQSNAATWLNSQGFGNVQTETYWSSTTYADDAGVAWYVYMRAGEEGRETKTYSKYVWSVRAGQ